MADINAVLKEQKEIGERMGARVQAFSTLATERKTREYLNERIKKLDDDWTKFTSNNVEIYQSDKMLKTHEYIANKYYLTIEAIVTDYRGQLIAHLDKLNQSRNDDQSNNKSNVDPAILFRTSNNQDPVQMVNVMKTSMANLDKTLRDYDAKESNLQINDARTIRQMIMKKWELVSDMHSKIVFTPGYDVHTYFKMESKMEKIFQSILEDKTRATTSNTKLPKLELPKFKGDYLEWEPFQQLFMKMIDNQESLSGSEKLAYLKGQMEGEPKTLIEALPVLDESYQAAWDLLNRRFRDRHMILKTALDKIFRGEKMNSRSIQHMKKVYDSVNQTRMIIDNMKITSDVLLEYIFYYAVENLTDPHSLNIYETTLTEVGELRNYEHFMKFMNMRIHHLSSKYEGTSDRFRNYQKPQSSHNDKNSKNKVSIALVANKQETKKPYIKNRANNDQCNCRDQEHKMVRCPNFLKKTTAERLKEIKKGRCFNCLSKGHSNKACTETGCKKCDKKHNVLLHLESAKNVQTILLGQKQEKVEHVFLATVTVNIIDKNGSPVQARALLDSGSQINLMTEKMHRKLGLTYKCTSMTLLGIGEVKTNAKKRTTITVKSPTSNFQEQLEVFLLKTVTTEQPEKAIDISNWKIPSSIQLADKQFHVPSKVDLILGGEIFFKLIQNGEISIGDGLPSLQRSVFGWIVTGKVLGLTQSQAYVGIATESALETQVAKFWAIEEKTQEKKQLTQLELSCEMFFKNTTKRDETSGKFIVHLQFTKHPSILGNSEKMAIRRFQHLERRFKNDPEMKAEYVQFLREYESLGHMTEVDRQLVCSKNYMIPHHAVRNPSSSTTKFRVVFDGSAKTTSNVSLNEILANGPVLQNDLFSIMVRFRTHQYALSADITKMYRQVEVCKDERPYQMIVWREDDNQPLKYYELNTLTYGTTCASYLAIKCLHELAEQRKNIYPLAYAPAKKDFNVDDLMTGSDQLTEAVGIQQQMIKMCNEAHFELHKWCSNHPILLAAIPKKKEEISLDINAEKQETKALGIKWVPKDDIFKISYTPKDNKKITKRTVLSESAQLFDPLGMVNPVILIAKMFMQKLCLIKMDWDTELSDDLQVKWKSFRKELLKLNDISFPRKTIIENAKDIQLHGFSDASEAAYGTCFYLRSIASNGEVQSSLICSKSRVAPISSTTLPRLELCGAVTMVELAAKLKEVLHINISKTVFWTDSEIVLSWIRGDRNHKTFVANRVATIKRKTSIDEWRYVNTKENPADLISRGVLPEDLQNSTLWWHGPKFLIQPADKWPIVKEVFVNEPSEERQIKTVLMVHQSDHFIDRINHKNSFPTLQRIVAYMLRVKHKPNTSSEITITEQKRALNVILRYAQQEFHTEMKIIEKGYAFRTKFGQFSPFIDEEGILRVGGRLKKASINYEHKHPAILRKDHFITRLIMEDIHRNNHHAGAQALLSFTRQHYWPESGKRLATKIVKDCVLCTRSKPILMQQIMGHLPSERVNIARAFVHTSLDFMGPIEVHNLPRGKRVTKGYICIFVCLTTKAVHMEAAPDLSIDGFVGCLKRFIARRGLAKKIICDNGTNFRGTHNKLEELYEIITSEKAKRKIRMYCVEREIEWFFTPARSPHFNGLSEAAVKSAKTHLRKILHSIQITFVELGTMAAEVEAILNSRPLTAMSNDPNDIQPLTPGHFLIGAPLNAIDDRLLPYNSKNKLWHKLVTIRNQFWERWSAEYLSELQGKTKWRSERDNVKMGDMVVIKKDNVKPLKWKIGRIMEVTKDEHGKVRVVKIKTAKAEVNNAINTRTKKVDTSKIKIKTRVITRSIHQICPLPTNTGNENDENPLAEPKMAESKSRQPKIEEKATKLNAEAVEFQPIAKRTRSRGIQQHLLLLFAFFAIIFGVSAKECEYTALQHSPGLYFEPKGQLGLSTDKWIINGYIRLNAYWKQSDQIEFLLRKTKQMCNKTTEEAYCNATVDLLQQQFLSLSTTNELFKSFFHRDIEKKRSGGLDDIDETSSPNQKLLSRKRRGWINFIGSGLKVVTGVMDDNDAQRINNQINELKNQNNHLLKIIGNQTSIQDLTTNILKKQEQGIRQQILYLKNQIDQTYNQTRGNFGYIVNMLAIQITTLIQDQLTQQNAIIDLITHVHHGKMSPIVISPAQLRQHLETISSSITNDLMIPGDNIPANMAHIYGLLDARIRVSPERILLKITLPLISRDMLKMHHIIPVPFVHIGNFRVITTPYQYIALNKRQDRYYMLTPQLYSQCSSFSDDTIICEQRYPIYIVQKEDTLCEMAILTHESKGIPPKCSITTMLKNHSWSKLMTPSSFIFSVQNQSILNIICKEIITTCSIRNSGIITIPPNCMAQTDNLEIASDYIYNDNKPVVINPALNVSNILDVRDNSQIYGDNAFPIYEMSKDLENLRSYVNQQKSDVIDPQLDIHHVHHYTIAYVLVLILVCSLAYVLIRHKWLTRQADITAQVELRSTQNITSLDNDFTPSHSVRDISFHVSE